MSSLCDNLWIVSLGQNIKRLRWEAGLQTQKALADLLGVPQPQVSDWENDRYAVLETLTLIKIAKGLRCSVDHLLAGMDPDYDQVREQSHAIAAAPAGADSAGEAPAESSARTEIPVIAEGDAFPAGVAWSDGARERVDIVQWIARPGDLQDPNAYGVQIRGDAMFPAYRPAMIAVVSPGNRVQHGDEVYVQLASGERLVRVAHAVQGNFVLQSYNHAYTARFAKPREIQAMHVIVYSRRRNC